MLVAAYKQNRMRIITERKRTPEHAFEHAHCLSSGKSYFCNPVHTYVTAITTRAPLRKVHRGAECRKPPIQQWPLLANAQNSTLFFKVVQIPLKHRIRILQRARCVEGPEHGSIDQRVRPEVKKPINSLLPLFLCTPSTVAPWCLLCATVAT